jgi:hypothetical protein
MSQKAGFWFGAVCAVLNGLVAPFYALAIGILFEVFNPYTPPEEVNALLLKALSICITITLAQFLFGWWSYAAT